MHRGRKMLQTALLNVCVEYTVRYRVYKCGKCLIIVTLPRSSHPAKITFRAQWAILKEPQDNKKRPPENSGSHNSCAHYERQKAPNKNIVNLRTTRWKPLLPKMLRHVLCFPKTTWMFHCASRKMFCGLNN